MSRPSAGPAARGWTGGITLALFPVALAINVAGLVREFGRPESLRVLAVALAAANLAWLMLEAPVSLRRPGTPPREVATLLAYSVARMATMGAALLGPIEWRRATPLAAAAALIFVCGVVLRQVAMRHLGQFYSHHVIRRDGHVIVQTGAYRVIRHPAYAGMLLAHVGLVLFFLNPAAVALLVALALIIGWRIRVEERELLVIPAYRDYAAGRPRLVPGLW